MNDNTQCFQVTDKLGQTYIFLSEFYSYEAGENKLYIFKGEKTEAYGIFFNPVCVLEMEIS